MGCSCKNHANSEARDNAPAEMKQDANWCKPKSVTDEEKKDVKEESEIPSNVTD
jgi:hypothetical protein